MDLMLEDVGWNQGLPASALAAVAERVMDGNIVILKGVFGRTLMERCQETILRWQSRTPPSNVAPTEAHEHWWRRDIDPPSKTPHLFETFCFVFDQADDEFAELASVFAQMRDIWQALVNPQVATEDETPELELRPQVIHYPPGGGFFDWHCHALAPQRIGLIVGMSRYGRDFHSGGSVFRTGAVQLDTSCAHDQGDICLFRYDLNHSVSAVDSERAVEWNRYGRWTMVLPLL